MLEREILGCFIKDNELIKETKVVANYFVDHANIKVFETMQRMALNNQVVDKVTLISECHDLIADKGMDFITSLETTGDIKHFEDYEKQLIAKYKERKSREITSHFLSNDDDINMLISQLQKLTELDIEEEKNKNDILKELANLPFSESTDEGIKSNLKSLDKIIGGFLDANSYILGARPSMGKSAVMLKFALSAIEQDVVPVIISLEMSKESLLKRLISTIGKINLFLTRTPQELTDGKKEAWMQAVGKLHSYEFDIYDKSMQTINEIRSNVRKTQRKYPNKKVMILIDYLTLIGTTGDYNSDHQRVSQISKDLKNMAKDFNCPVITLAQLSRSVEQRQDKRPNLSDLRESGSIEEDADGVMFLYRDSYYNPENEDNVLEINVAKHRNGPTGNTEVYYNKSTGIMGDLSVY